MMDVPIEWRRNPRARKYILRYQPPRGLVATIPRGGSKREALAFIERSKPWIQRQMEAQASRPPATEVWFRGERAPLMPNEQMREIAVAELVPRTVELAARCGLEIGRVSIRNQRSRWGSCSIRRTISLNWRLIQTPPFVVDYLILHELMHLREMNHSNRFWAEVEKVCPTWREAERWLRQYGREIMHGN